ncbi:MAG: rhodanese-like domain-containing protein [Chroococcales cyanobacterium]
MSSIDKNIEQAKENMPEMTITPPPFQEKSSPQALKERLEWGEPAFSIIDVRDRSSFNKSRIMGAITMPMNQDMTPMGSNFIEQAKAAFEPEREIYIYAENDQQTAQAASQMRQAGFEAISELQGGLAAWKDIGGPTEGTEEQGEKVVGSGAYNIGDRLKEQGEINAKY